MYQPDIPEDHVALLHALTGTPVTGDAETRALPTEIVERYWALSRCYGRVNMKLTVGNLAQLAYECGFGCKLSGEEWDDLSLLAKDKKIRSGDPCQVLWRKTWKDAKFIRVSSGKKIVAQIEGDTEERFFNSAHVKLPKVGAAA